MNEMAGAEGGERAPSVHWRTIMLVVATVLGAAVLAALIVTVRGANRERDRALQLQSHSYEVMILTRTLAGTIQQAEASLGRYVISGDKKLGQIYFEQWQQAGNEIARLAQVTVDSPEQQQRIAALRTAYQTRGDELSTTALSTFYHKNNQALARFYKARNGKSLRQISTLLDDISSYERGLLAARSSIAGQSIQNANQVVKVLVAFGVLIVLGLVVLGWLTVRTLGERAAARAEAEAERLRVEGLEEAIADATAELKQQAIERAETEAKLRQVQKMEAVGQLTGGIAHDFNNMLAVVLGGLELARRHLDTAPDQAGRHIDHAVEGATRAAALTRRLLAFSRAEALLPEALEAGALIAGMSELLDRTLGDAITVVTGGSTGGWHIWADAHQLENALLNLAVNARDAMDGRGILTITVGGCALADGAIGECVGGDYVTIAVTDTGSGMAPEVRERVFEPFFTTKPVGKGTGLGLSQIFGFVRQSDGEIAIESAPGMGTTVTVYLPRHADAAARAVAPRPIEVAPAAAGTGRDVLVVEDDPRVLTATMGALAELGHRPVACGDPAAAAGLLDAHPAIDLVVSDVLMPGITGPEMIASLLPQFPYLGVLFVTGYSGEATEAQFGGHPVLRKPFTLTALERALSDVAAAERPGAADRIAAE